MSLTSDELAEASMSGEMPCDNESSGTMKNTWKSPALGAVLIFLLTIVAYLPALRGGFIWDDDDHLTANPAMTATQGLRMIWSSLAVSRYYPLTLTSFWVQRQLWGLNPAPYHLVNIVVHAFNGVLIFFVLRRLQIPAAWLAAALWVLHPVNVESVAWITELKNTQSALFFFCAVLCYLRFETEGLPRWYALALLCGACALLSKASTVVLPLVLLLSTWWQRGTWRRIDIVRTVPFFVMASLMSVLAIVEQRGHIARQGTPEWKLGITQRVLLPGKAAWFYLGKVVWPANYVFVYPRWDLAANAVTSWLPLMGMIAIGFVLWKYRRHSWARVGILGLGFFVTALLPVLGFFDVYYFRYSFVADHFQYLASLGVITCVASGIAYILKRCKMWSSPTGNVICAMLLVMLGSLTWAQTHIYRDSETLWRDTATRNPVAWIAHNNLGVLLENQKRETEAIAQYREAARLNPEDAEAHNNLGFALSHAGQIEEAISQYNMALRIDPSETGALNNLGNALAQMGKPQEAIDQFENALRIKPNDVDAHNNLGTVLLRMGRVQEAIGHWELALRIKPDYPEAHNNLAIALAQAGRPEEAMKHWEEALRIRPDFTEARKNLEMASGKAGTIDKAK